jgi:hypothetical protein
MDSTIQLMYDNSHNVKALSYKYNYEITIMRCFAAAPFLTRIYKMGYLVRYKTGTIKVILTSDIVIILYRNETKLQM